MPALVYIHGFLSSPQSFKAQATQHWLADQIPSISFICPALSSYPEQAAMQLDRTLDALKSEKVYLIGSSLGGFWASWLIETERAHKAVLINPAVEPQVLVESLIGQTVENYYNGESYKLQKSDAAFLKQCDLKVEKSAAYWLMVQQGDETLDYRKAVNKYHRCKQLVEKGGSHTFDNYQQWLPKIMQFLSE
ncbi:hypothetical protein SAMN02745866_04005 [Alteromonadaceae bacterium Bs31]|nr:hypothetical protein SAMN02745866_04005 [Alteromonadaceae bacterium Bs31]